jgi:RNA polymerase sigma factor (sigma-70 family)
MLGTPVNPILRHVRTLLGPAAPLPDAELLRRYLARRDEAAFAALVARHGPMVLSVCEAVLGHRQDAEDAFQATFLVLVRRGSAIRRHDSLASWLHGVAHRLALKARAAAARRHAREAALPPPALHLPGDDLTWRDLRGLLHEELARLPDPLRAPLLLCYLEGLTRDEVARRLGWTATTVKGRLDRGRKLLHDRLARRGVTLGGATLALGASAAVPAALAAAAVRAAGGTATDAAASLAGALLRASLSARIKVLAAVVLLLGIMGTGAGLLLAPAAPPADEKPAAEARPADPRLDPFGDPLPAGALARMGTTRLRHGGELHAVAFAPDGKTIASAGDDGVVRVWDSAGGKELVRFVGKVRAESVAFSPDGKLIASTGPSLGVVAFVMPVHLWEAATGREVRQFQGTGELVAFSPDGKTLVTVNGADLILCDVAGVNEPRRIKDGGARCAAFSPDGKTLATAQDGGTLELWDVATGRSRKQLATNEGLQPLVAFLPDGKSLISADVGDARLWDAVTGKETARWSFGHHGRIQCLAVSPDGKSVAWGGTWNDAAAHLSDALTGKELRRFGSGAVTSVAFSPDGKRLVTAADNRVQVWDTATGKDLCPLDGSRGGVYRLAFSGGGKTLFSADGGPAVRAWESATGRPRPAPAQSSPWELRLWESATGRQLPKLADDQALAGAMAFSPDRKTLATANPKGELRLWDTANGRELHRLGPPRGVAHLAFTPDGTVLAVADSYRKVCLWDTATGEEWARPTTQGLDPPLGRHFARHYTGQVFPAFSPDGKVLAYSKDTKTVCFWDMATKKELWSLTDEALSSVAFAPDGRTAVVGDTKRRLRVFDTTTGRELRLIPGVDAAPLTFAPDGRTLAARDGKDVVILDPATGRELRRLVGHKGAVTVVTFAPDGRTLASGSADGTALVWDIADRRGGQ